MFRQFAISFGVNKQSCRIFIVIALLSRVCSMHELRLGSPCIVFSLPLGGFTRNANDSHCLRAKTSGKTVELEDDADRTDSE